MPIQAPFIGLHCFYRVSITSPFSIYRVKRGPIFGFTGFLQSQARHPFFLDFQAFYSVKQVLFFSDCKRFFTSPDVIVQKYAELFTLMIKA